MFHGTNHTSSQPIRCHQRNKPGGEKGKKGRRVKGPEDVESLAQNMTALSVGGSGNNEEEKTSHVDECDRGGGAVQRSPKWEHFDGRVRSIIGRCSFTNRC